ncbi:MAG TPA: hypothetical protein VMU84_06395, partial [Thermoanaerobaculia bacterium]|nr:hypothetical protein [Thermoanaerobaculia bacterium]
PRGGGEAKLVVAAETIHPEVSADGQYVAYHRPEADGTQTIVVVRVSDGTVIPLAQVRGLFALRVRWIGATHTVAFRALDERGQIALFAQNVGSSTRRMLVSLDVTPETYAISPDGTHAIVSVLDEASGLMIADGLEIP